MSAKLQEDQLWETGRWREIPRRVWIDEFEDGDVLFHFDDGQTSRCSTTAFRRTYEPVP